MYIAVHISDNITDTGIFPFGRKCGCKNDFKLGVRIQLSWDVTVLKTPVISTTNNFSS
jgi:hypothetical protein